jgi:hypothetical protein
VGAGPGQGNFANITTGDGVALAGTVGMPLGPRGMVEPLWVTYGKGIVGADGGWENNRDLLGIDPTKTYRSSVWVWHWGIPPNGAVIYHGCDPAYTRDLSGAINTNPFFTIVNTQDLVVGRWYLLVGFIHGAGYGAVPAGLGGIYDGVTGLGVAPAIEFKNAPGAPQQMQRTYQYYSNAAGLAVVFARPRFEEVNGSEPSILSLLGVVGTEQIAENAATEQVISTVAYEVQSRTTTGVLGSQIASVSYINNGAEAVGIEISYFANLTLTSNNVNVVMGEANINLLVDLPGPGIDVTADEGAPPVYSGGGYNGQVPLSKTYVANDYLLPGMGATWFLRWDAACFVSGAGGTFTAEFYDGFLRITVLKR